MFVTKKITNFTIDKTTYLNYEEDSSCPICKAKISPIFIDGSLNTLSTASIFNHCRGCSSTFITNYQVRKSAQSHSTANYYDVDRILSSVPNTFKEETFSEEISKLSVSFVKIYNQSLAAETSELDEIAGLGYRKSLEFLIKDFATSEHPDEESTIKSMNLSQCINKYISDPSIKTLAIKSAWIGNDEAHYIRKQVDRDVSDMKKFIQACVYFISMIQITKDAETIEPK